MTLFMNTEADQALLRFEVLKLAAIYASFPDAAIALADKWVKFVMDEPVSETPL